MRNRIIISAANGPIMRSLVLKLKKNGFYIIGLDSSKFGLAYKFCDEFYKAPKGNDKDFPKFLNKISSKAEAIYLYVDEEIENISKNIKNFPNLIKKVILSPRKTLQICNNKRSFHNFFKSKKIKIPPINFKGLNIIKPSAGRGGKNVFTSKEKSVAKLFKNNSKYLVQKYIFGTEYTVDSVFDKNGNLIFAIPRKRIVAQNVSIVGMVKNHKKLIKKIKQISLYLRFYGPINFQFIENNEGIWLIEINPRLSGSVIFSIISGFNPVTLSYQIHLDKKIILPKKINYNETHYRYWDSISQ
jgi:carbamoyl-phosphate synthase large subunit